MVSPTAASPSSAPPPARFRSGLRGLFLNRRLDLFLGFFHDWFGDSLRIAQETEHARLDPDERSARSLLHRAGELGLHCDLRGSPHEGQEFALQGFFGQLFVVQGFTLALQDLKRRFEECHRACFFTTNRAPVVCPATSVAI